MAHPLPAAALLTALPLILGTPVLAEEVTLTSHSGGLVVSGKLLGFDGQFYRLDSKWGPLSLNAEAMVCTGQACPDPSAHIPQLRLALEPWLTDLVLRPLLQIYAQRHGLTLSQTDQPPSFELSKEGALRLRIPLVFTHGPTAPLLADGRADAALLPKGESTPLAHIPMSLVSGPEAPIGRITLEALQDLPKDWRSLGGDNRPLVWHDLAKGGILEARAESLLGDRGAVETSPDLPALAQRLARDPWGLALFPGPLPKPLKQHPLFQDCGLHWDMSDFAQASGEHPLMVPIYLHHAKRLPAAAKALIAGLRPLPVKTLPLPFESQGPRLSDALRYPAEITLPQLTKIAETLATASRLGTTLRYEGKDLTPASTAALHDLADAIAANSYLDHEILLIGFSDPAGEAEANRAEALTRAEEAKALLLAELDANAQITALSFGEAFPILCEASPRSRQINRRVEVWIRPLGHK